MSWIQKLSETYDKCTSAIGIDMDGDDNTIPLLPICHTTNKAQVEIVIDQDGNFRRANVIAKNDARTIIPCTESSGGRTSGESPHPLCDKLQYVAQDYLEKGGSKKYYFESYKKQLEDWNNSDQTDPKITAILAYVSNGTVVNDLISHKVLVEDANGNLEKKWIKRKDVVTPAIFDVTATQDDIFIRWIVEIPGVLESKVWRDNILWEKWIKYYTKTKENSSLCYISGTDELSAEQHPAKIRNDGDKAKLISSNDEGGYTFRGRFQLAEQAASIGFVKSQKAHFALRWLIGRQGYRSGDLAIVAWATSGKPVPKPLDDAFSLLGMDTLQPDETEHVYTAQNTAIRLKKKIAGYRQELGTTTDIIVIGLDSATPGRLSITFYRELSSSDFLDRLNNWHETCAWQHSYRSIKTQNEDTGKTGNKPSKFIGAPAPRDIAEAAYGLRVDDKLRAATVSRILPCILDGQQIPRDLVESTYRQACNRMGKDFWEWQKTLSIACSLYKKFNIKENYDMSLELNRTTRDYLYGRLLALAESLEEWALNVAKENRETNAARLMQRFAERPFSTWRTIELALSPYKARLGGKALKRLRLIDEVIASFQEGDFTSDKRLSGEFLLGYHCQREDLRNAAEIKDLSEEIIQNN